MRNAPDPQFGKRVARSSIWGVLMAVGGIVLFIVLWVALGSAGLDNLPRLLISLCLPPLVIALVMGVYLLVRRSD